MLTKKQAELFRLLEIKPEEEPRIRQHYKLIRQMGGGRFDFTRWLEDCLKAKWRNENKHIYLGD